MALDLCLNSIFSMLYFEPCSIFSGTCPFSIIAVSLQRKCIHKITLIPGGSVREQAFSSACRQDPRDLLRPSSGPTDTNEPNRPGCCNFCSPLPVPSADTHPPAPRLPPNFTQGSPNSPKNRLRASAEGRNPKMTKRNGFYPVAFLNSYAANHTRPTTKLLIANHTRKLNTFCKAN
jgi:hypothetical protein